MCGFQLDLDQLTWMIKEMAGGVVAVSVESFAFANTATTVTIVSSNTSY
jgi:hypothetical protein